MQQRTRSDCEAERCGETRTSAATERVRNRIERCARTLRTATVRRGGDGKPLGKIRREQPGTSQKNRRTSSTSRTRRPCHGKSVNVRA
jgi:hypothetical protein